VPQLRMPKRRAKFALVGVYVLVGAAVVDLIYGGPLHEWLVGHMTEAIIRR
jgi:hypothetical protein